MLGESLKTLVAIAFLVGLIAGSVFAIASQFFGLTPVMHAEVEVVSADVKPPKGLVGWWRFDEGGGAVAQDSSGKGHSGYLKGCRWATGVRGSSVEFDGWKSCVEVEDSPDLNSISTWEAWIRWRGPTSMGGYGIVVCRGEQRAGQGCWFIYVPNSGDSLGFGFSDGLSINSLTWRVDLSDGSWHHVVMVREGEDFELYFDGEPQGVRNARWMLEPEKGKVYIGSYQGKMFTFCGQIDEVALYSRKLTELEVMSHYLQRGAIPELELVVENKGTDPATIDSVYISSPSGVSETIPRDGLFFTGDGVIMPGEAEAIYASPTGLVLEIGGSYSGYVKIREGQVVNFEVSGS